MLNIYDDSSCNFDDLSFGDIIFLDNVIFDNGTKNSNERIPCVFLCTMDNVVYAMKLSGNRRFFKKKEKYVQLSESHEINLTDFHLVNIRDIIKTNKENISAKIGLLEKDDRDKLESKIDSLSKRQNIYKFLLNSIKLERVHDEKMRDSSTSSEQLMTHIFNEKELFPNGSGRTREEFENDNRNIYKKFILSYKNLNNR